MFNKLFLGLRSKIEAVNKQKGGESMPVAAPTRSSRDKIDDLLEQYKDLVVKRDGKDIVLTGDGYKRVLSGDKLELMVDAIVKANATTRIRTSGLSRAQVEKIAGSFVDEQVPVKIRRVPYRNSNATQLQQYVIVVRGGKNNV